RRRRRQAVRGRGRPRRARRRGAGQGRRPGGRGRRDDRSDDGSAGVTTHPERTTSYDADERGWFGAPGTGFGGRFMPEALVAALDELTAAWHEAMADPSFVAEFDAILREYAGLPSPLYHAERLSERLGARILLKRE